MRRTLSLALIALILFNTMGYYGLLLGLQYRNDKKLIQALDADTQSNSDYISASDYISIKIPMVVPYATGSQDYERVNGVFEHDGEFLRLVKQRFYQDTLEIVCIKDIEHKEINQALARHANAMSDKTDDVPLSQLNLFKKEFIATTISFSTSASGWNRKIILSQFELLLTPGYIAKINKPPERI